MITAPLRTMARNILRYGMPPLMLCLLPLGITAASAESEAEIHAKAASCVGQCQIVLRDCAAGRDLTTCLSEERLCLAECDPAALAIETRHARALNSLYQDRPDLLRMRLVHERTDADAVCRERCDDAARICVETSRNTPEPCHEARRICRDRCPTLEKTAE